MGGSGALKLGTKFPELFCSIPSHSGDLNITKRKQVESGKIRESNLSGEKHQEDWTLCTISSNRSDPTILRNNRTFKS